MLVALDFLVEIHHPLGTEVGSTMCWFAGQILRVILIIEQNLLKAFEEDAKLQLNMKKALYSQAVLAMLAMPLQLTSGLLGRGRYVRKKRWKVDQRGDGGKLVESEQAGNLSDVQLFARN